MITDPHTASVIDSARRGTPSVSQKWNDLPCKAEEDQTAAEILLQRAVQAERIFVSDGQGGTGGTDELRASLIL